MLFDFFKYQGSGNDFILIDDRKGLFPSGNYKWVEKLCDRRFGIGADGLMLLRAHPQHDFEMIYYNADGKPGSMCGNGGRCITAFAQHLQIINNEANFLAVDGPHYAKISAKSVSLQMVETRIQEAKDPQFLLNTGSPHFVEFVDQIQRLDVYSKGKAIRYNERFRQEGVNVNFVEVLHDRQLFVRTYERGVENETLSCGTGVTAAALCYAEKTNITGTGLIGVSTLGGELSVSFIRKAGGDFSEIFLEGPANLVFKGHIEYAE